MSSPTSSSEPSPESGFQLLDERIQRWVWSKGWTALRDAQEKAIRPILEGKNDVIIAAATASGKTEAAFLPILTRLVNSGEELGLAIYISPLKALINDQWGRLEELCEMLDLPVVPWHGDISAAKKQRFLKVPRGVLLITPESLEALFVRRGSQVRRLFAEASYVVVDELHSFIGSDRGKQMQSLLHRIEAAAERRIPRVGLSATLGEMTLAAEYLRPDRADSVEVVVSKAAGQYLQVQVRGYVVPAHSVDASNAEMAEPGLVAQDAVADHLFKVLRGTNNLIFPNTRQRVEFYADALRRRCEAVGCATEFWPHHGSLSRDIRESAEHALKDGGAPASAVCTNTLELGIDIGAIKSVAQIGPGPSVASLRQRLGRSGRKPGEPAVLRSYAIEQEITPDSTYSDCLREGLVQSTAMIQLLLRGWCETPNAGGLHLSTLVQQSLSVIAEKGGSTASALFKELIVEGAFAGLTPAEFADLLRSLASKDLIVQDPTGLLLLGTVGERLVASYEFYAAFSSEDEWQIVGDGRKMGSLPIRTPVVVGTRLIFAGRRWLIRSVDTEAQILSVVSDPGGAPPAFDSGSPSTSDVVRREMRDVLHGNDPIRFLDHNALTLLTEARTQYRVLLLDTRQFLYSGVSTTLFTWSGDPANDALTVLLRSRGLPRIDNEGLTVTIGEGKEERIVDALSDIAALEDADLTSLLKDVFNMRRGKWDWALPDGLLRRSFVSSHLSLEGARSAAKRILATLS
jgi:ATP-dependent helicase Lhr and Lhr-like helicase